MTENLKHNNLTESGDCGAPFATEYLLDEEKRILADFDKVKAKVK